MPISGYADGLAALKFLLLPVLIGVVAGLGSGLRWYRTIFLEEIGKDYVRTARAKGLSELRVLFRHVLRNALIPILTGVVVVIPLLFMGRLLTESFFGIPGLGSYTIDAINSAGFRDRARDGVPRIGALHPRPAADRHLLHAGRSAREVGLMPILPVLLWTDALIFLLLASAVGVGLYASRREPLRAPWRQVRQRPVAMAAMVVLLAYVGIGLLDSVHFQTAAVLPSRARRRSTRRKCCPCSMC
ncbi:MAG: ABC transporter permease [Candidatus Manganitrophus sp.]|nr:ABC transporter permease [Candidatus Manganitrophus sp.]